MYRVSIWYAQVHRTGQNDDNVQGVHMHIVWKWSKRRKWSNVQGVHMICTWPGHSKTSKTVKCTGCPYDMHMAWKWSKRQKPSNVQGVHMMCTYVKNSQMYRVSQQNVKWQYASSHVTAKRWKKQQILQFLVWTAVVLLFVLFSPNRFYGRKDEHGHLLLLYFLECILIFSMGF